ncbi:MAG: glucose PTS transporter subunit IIA [Anaerostipes sp.]|nr:glucose PTS transporter subunit IIA [Anaerostipes sp.]
MKNKIFEIFQRIGRSFMLPIAILPVAGLLLGIGQSFTNENMLNEYHLMNIMGPGTIPYTILKICGDCGNAVFQNLPLIFAVGVAIGMAKAEKEVAALSGAIAFFIMNTATGSMIAVNGGAKALHTGATVSIMGITSLQMGVFGGIIVGLGVAALHNRFYKVKLPEVVSFFGGTRFVPIICTVVYVFVGILMFYIWQPIQNGMYAVGEVVRVSGYFGTFIYGVMERALIPFGLHHVFYLPFWQTSLGGTMEIAGKTIEGAQNIFFAQLADPGTGHFVVSATRFMTGKFPLMIFGLPGAALAMYRCAEPKRRKVVGGLLLSAALTSLLTGITEPIEFTFLFLAPGLYAIHCGLAGLSYMLMHMLKVCVGLTFSGGVIDLFLFGVMQGQNKTNWMTILPIGLIYFLMYYALFSYVIKRFDLKTPGRGEIEEEKIPVKEELRQGQDKTTVDKEAEEIEEAEKCAYMIAGLGGKSNIIDLDCCATRLRCTLKNGLRISEYALNIGGARGIIRKGNGVQIIYGPQVTVLKSNLESYLSSTLADHISIDKIEIPRDENINVETVYNPVRGKVIPLDDVKDDVFSNGMLGDGFAVEPATGVVYAPVNGTISVVFSTKHAIGINSEGGAEILIHLGLDTVKLNGEYYNVMVEPGMKVFVGDRIATFDMHKIKKAGFSLTTPVVVSNSEDFTSLTIEKTGRMDAKKKVMSVKK